MLYSCTHMATVGFKGLTEDVYRPAGRRQVVPGCRVVGPDTPRSSSLQSHLEVFRKTPALRRIRRHTRLAGNEVDRSGSSRGCSETLPGRDRRSTTDIANSRSHFSQDRQNGQQ